MLMSLPSLLPTSSSPLLSISRHPPSPQQLSNAIGRPGSESKFFTHDITAYLPLVSGIGCRHKSSRGRRAAAAAARAVLTHHRPLALPLLLLQRCRPTPPLAGA